MSATQGKHQVTKSISLPPDLFAAADERVKRLAAEEELDWSKYVRRLIRADLRQAGAEKEKEGVAA